MRVYWKIPNIYPTNKSSEFEVKKKTNYCYETYLKPN